MIKIQAVIRVNNAADRKQDADFAKDITLPAVPANGDSLWIRGSHFAVQLATYHDDQDYVSLRLAPDNRTFREPDKFEQQCKKILGCGFHAVRANLTKV